MLYKPENVVDLDTGALLSAEVREGDEGDSQGLAERVVAVAELVEAMREENGKGPRPAGVKTITADKGYYCVEELEAIQVGGIKTVISDPIRNRKKDKLAKGQGSAVRRAFRAVKSKYGKALLRRRGMHIERSFAHLLDSGGGRRTTLRGRENLRPLQRQLQRSTTGFCAKSKLQCD